VLWGATVGFPPRRTVRLLGCLFPPWTAFLAVFCVGVEKEYERRFPLKYSKFQISLLAVVVLVALRVTIGWHFFYEGVWKIVNADQFSATPFLTMAKGPAAPLFYAMVYDIDGRQRLKLEEKEGKKVITGKTYLDAWKGQLDAAIKKYGLDGEQKKQAESLYETYEDSATEYLAENLTDIDTYFGSLDRFEAAKKAGGDNAAYKKKRNWDEQEKLRGEVDGWLGELDGMGGDFRAGLWGLLNEDQRAKGAIPEGWTRADFMDLAVTYSLTAIGLCLIIGFCNRLACLGGAGFLVAGVLTQPPWPAVYPPMPQVTGPSLIVDKNFVEMMAMLALACLPAGRWGGLDFFVYRWFGRPILSWLGRPVE
jgi:uncharacterized membrane protein YphA (DoxX/SURF4 family)